MVAPRLNPAEQAAIDYVAAVRLDLGPLEIAAAWEIAEARFAGVPEAHRRQVIMAVAVMVLAREMRKEESGE